MTAITDIDATPEAEEPVSVVFDFPEEWTSTAQADPSTVQMRAPVDGGMAPTLALRLTACQGDEAPGDCAQRVLDEHRAGALTSTVNAVHIDEAAVTNGLGIGRQVVTAGRVGRSLVTTVAWIVAIPGGAALLIGVADADHLPVAAPIFDAAFASLRLARQGAALGDEVEAPVEPPAPAQPQVQALPGWTVAEGRSGQVVATAPSPGYAPRLVATVRRSDGAALAVAHERDIAQVGAWLTDLVLDPATSSTLAGRAALRSEGTAQTAGTALRITLLTALDGDLHVDVLTSSALDVPGAIADLEQLTATLELTA